jgi:hypothetical protein
MTVPDSPRYMVLIIYCTALMLLGSTCSTVPERAEARRWSYLWTGRSQNASGCLDDNARRTDTFRGGTLCVLRQESNQLVAYIHAAYPPSTVLLCVTRDGGKSAAEYRASTDNGTLRGWLIRMPKIAFEAALSDATSENPLETPDKMTMLRLADGKSLEATDNQRVFPLIGEVRVSASGDQLLSIKVQLESRQAVPEYREYFSFMIEEYHRLSGIAPRASADGSRRNEDCLSRNGPLARFTIQGEMKGNWSAD